jgi:hypothetical protein
MQTEYMQGSTTRHRQRAQHPDTLRTMIMSDPSMGVKLEEETHAKGLEEPLVLSARVTVLEQLLDGLFRVLMLRDLLEGLAGDGALEPLKLECVSCGEKVRVVHDLQI